MINFQLSLDSENDPFRTIKGRSLERLLLRTPGAFQESYLLSFTSAASASFSCSSAAAGAAFSLTHLLYFL